MSLIRRLARPMLAAPFVYEGVRTALHPEREIDVAPAAFAQVDKALENSSMPRAIDAAAIVRATGVVAAGAGVLYGMGRAPRVTSLLLLATTSVGLANRKKIWEMHGEARNEEIARILSDLGLLGGVMLAVADTDGSPSIAYRVNKLVERGQKSAAEKQKELEKSAEALGKKARKAPSRRKAKKLAKKAEKGTATFAKTAGKKADAWQKEAGKMAGQLRKDAPKKAEELQKAAGKKADEWQKVAARAYEDAVKAVERQLG